MTSWDIIVVLAGAPLAILVLLGLLTLRPNFRRRPRYRPGGPWNYPPVWWAANPEVLSDSQSGHQHQPQTGARAAHGGSRGDW